MRDKITEKNQTLSMMFSAPSRFTSVEKKA